MNYLTWRISYQSSEQAARAAFNEWQKKSAECEPVATVTISHFRGSKEMENRDFDYFGELPEGTHRLFTTPQPCPEIYSKDVMNRIQTICEQSLTPEIYDKWLEVSEALYKTRRDLK